MTNVPLNVGDRVKTAADRMSDGVITSVRACGSRFIYGVTLDKKIRREFSWGTNSVLLISEEVELIAA